MEIASMLRASSFWGARHTDSCQPSCQEVWKSCWEPYPGTCDGYGTCLPLVIWLVSLPWFKNQQYWKKEKRLDLQGGTSQCSFPGLNGAVRQWAIQFEALKAWSSWVFPADGSLLLVCCGTVPLKCSTLSIQHITWASGSLHFCSTFFGHHDPPSFYSDVNMEWSRSTLAALPSGVDFCKEGEVCLSLSESLYCLDKLDVLSGCFYLFISFFLLLTHYSKRATAYTDVDAGVLRFPAGKRWWMWRKRKMAFKEWP